MRELDCDFCGGIAAGAYEVIPADLDPAPDEQARVVLCDSCRETLDGVLSPLLDRLGADGASDAPPSLATDDAGHASPSAATGGDDGIDETDDDPALAIDTAGHASPPPAERESDSGGTDADATESADTDTTEPTDADATESVDPAGSTTGEEPANFRKVMRFLNNREFPVARAEVAEFAAGAYDLEDEEVREIFEYAIERGVLAEEDGQLMKG
ncbi:hypothetical protein [Halobaculum halobium]|uniref:Uncharacterized protein n=2 Tax=Halobaculum halobium TaxID=3032281 RepID=A0ABD5THF1_9EURY|nr:hypothetical protein [Halobaculum sp. SYNS20]